MNIAISIIKLLGGVALLIYGMKILSTNLKKISGSKLEKILIQATDNPFKGLFVGFLITVATQSSAATTVLVVGLVNSNILKLRNAIPIIMGANIGTTINSQVLRLANLEGSAWVTLLSPATFAPLILVIGLIIIERGKNQNHRDVGQMIIGLGLLFTGMITMVNTASSFAELPILSTILQKLSNPVFGVFAGMIITAIVQSSAATVGILQALSITGKITYATTIPIILGQNIGTCITSIIASIGGNRNAKRVAAVHLYFNLLGTIIFLTFIYLYQHFVGFSFWDSTIDMGGIANFHMIFNVVSTIILFPFMGQIEKLTILTVKDKEDNSDDAGDDDYLSTLNMLDEGVINIPSIAIVNSTDVIKKMGETAEKNFRKTMNSFSQFDMKQIERIQEREDAINKMEEVLTKFLIRLGQLDLSSDDSNSITSLLKIESEFEKIGDYAHRLSKTSQTMNERKVKVSAEAYKEMQIVYNITEDAILKAMKVFEENDLSLNVDIVSLRELLEVKKEKYKSAHIQRLKEGKCSVESGMVFIEVLNATERIMDHCFNIAIATSNYVKNENIVTKQEYYKRIYKENSQILKDKLNEYSIEYEN